MRPYLAIIRDSFREALASRVLWLLFVMITLLLASLAPLGYRQTVTRGLDDESVGNWPQFIERIRDDAERATPSPSKRLVGLLDDEMKKKVVEFKIPSPEETAAAFKFARTVNEIRRAINQQLEKRDFYDAASWRKVTLLSEEARKFAKSGTEKLSDDDVARFNRLLMESAYPDIVAPSPPLSVRFCYLWYDLGDPLPIRKAEFVQILETTVSIVMNWFVGVLGVFVAILVTAPIIPQTFDPGVLNLLLSKPVRRSLVFVSKFFGGCAFIALNATYLVCGLLLILGFRFGIWDAKLLLGIPVYVFIFAIYYSVSAVAGLVWRNAIVSVAVSILFWICCFGVGTAKVWTEQFVLDKVRIVSIIPAGEDLIAVNEIAATFLWDKDARDWKEIFIPAGNEEAQRRMAMAFMPSVPAEFRPIGPIYDRENERLVSTYRSIRNGQMALNVGRREDQWKNVRGANASIGTVAMLNEPDGKILVVSSFGLYRLTGDPTAKNDAVKVLGFSLPFSSSGPFQSVGPESGLVVARPVDAKLNSNDGRLAIYSRGTLYVLEKQSDGRYRVLREVDLKLEPNRSVVLSFGGSTLLVGRDDGRIAVYDPSTLENKGEFAPTGNNPPRYMTVSPDGRRFAIVFHNGELWTYDVEKDLMTKARVADQGDISSAVFSAPDRLLVGHHTTRISEYEVSSWRFIQQQAPMMSLLETIYRYGISPVYYVFPKPGELDKTVQYILSGKETVQSGPGRADLSNAQAKLHPWRPVVSSLAFMLIVLAIGCIYIERQEF